MNYILFEKNKSNIFLIDMKKEENKIFSDLVYKWLSKYIRQWKKVALIVNKKWYSSWIFCQDCGNIPKCKNCDIPIAYHLDDNGNYFWLCHICKTYYEYSVCDFCGSYNIKHYWTWTQKIRNLIYENFGVDSLIIQSETVNSPNKIKKVYEKMSDYQVVIGTSLLSTNIKLVNFDLYVFINADVGLNVPDFNSNYRNFLFLYETIMNVDCPTFLVQSFSPESYSIYNACDLNFEKFRQEELSYRKLFSYPPYSQICVIYYKNEVEQKLFKSVSKLYKELLYLKENFEKESNIEIFSTPALIYKIFWKYRYNIVIKWDNLNEFMDYAYVKLNLNKRGFKVNFNAESLL